MERARWPLALATAAALGALSVATLSRRPAPVPGAPALADNGAPRPTAAPPRASSPASRVQLGVNASFGGQRLFPDDNAWNTPIDHIPVDPNSDRYIASIGADQPLHPDFGTVWNGKPWGIPYVIVPGDQPKVPVSFDYADQSDHELYPIPPNPPIEAGEDRHLLMYDRDNGRLYELFNLRWEGGGWRAGSGAVFDVDSNALRPAGWTSADAAGLPILPGLVRYDEVMEQKEIRHALRFTARVTRRAYVHPARHWASRRTEPELPPMGLRVRLRASYDISGFPPPAQVILRALKRYGMILADNGGNWYLSGAPHPKWPDDAIDTLKRVKGKDFEVIRIGNIVAE